MNKFLSLGSLALLAVPALAQNNLGTFRNTGVTFTSRGGAAAANNNASVQYTRFDVDKYAGWGADITNPAIRSFTGLHALIQDQDRTTFETFSLVAYQGDTANPGFPDLVNPTATSGNFVLPTTTGTGAVAWDITANFATPMTVPTGNDAYFGISQNAPWTIAGGVITDGNSVWAVTGNGTAATTDLPGASAPTLAPDNTYGGWFAPSVPSSAYSGSRQFFIEPVVTGSGGVASNLRTDALHVAAATAPGTSAMFSTQFPDAASPSRNAGRADDVGMVFLRTGIPDGSLVFWLADIAGTFGPELPLAGFVPGSTGVACINLATFSTLGFSLTAGGVASNVLTIPAAARASITGLPLIQQAVALDAGVLHAGPCQLSTF